MNCYDCNYLSTPFLSNGCIQPIFSGSGTNILNMDNYTTLIEKTKLLSQYVFGFPFGFLGYR